MRKLFALLAVFAAISLCAAEELHLEKDCKEIVAYYEGVCDDLLVAEVGVVLVKSKCPCKNSGKKCDDCILLDSVRERIDRIRQVFIKNEKPIYDAAKKIMTEEKK